MAGEEERERGGGRREEGGREGGKEGKREMESKRRESIIMFMENIVREKALLHALSLGLHSAEGTHRFEDPVSKITVKF